MNCHITCVDLDRSLRGLLPNLANQLAGLNIVVGVAREILTWTKAHLDAFLATAKVILEQNVDPG